MQVVITINNVCLDSTKYVQEATYYSDVIMSPMASQTIGVSMGCSTVCSRADQRRYQSSASLAFVRGIHI